MSTFIPVYCYNKKPLFSRLLSENINIKIYKFIIVSVVLYGGGT
jgi:hypothetical protein